MTILKAFIAAAVLIAPLAIADQASPTRTFEVSIHSIRLPALPGGTVTLRECEECEYETIRVTEQTRYRIGQEYVELHEFRKQLNAMKRNVDWALNVRRDNTTNTVSLIYMSLP